MKILMLLDNSFENDRRVYREALSLVENQHQVTILAIKDNCLREKENLDGINVERIIDPQIFNIKNKAYKSELASIITAYEFDVLHCHDQEMLNLGVLIKKIKPGTFLIYDSHELFHAWPLNLSSFNSKLVSFKSIIVRKLQIAREKRNIKKVDKIITVNDSLADNISEHFNVERPTIIRNVPETPVKDASSFDLRKKLKISRDKKILVFIGANIYRFSLNVEQVLSEIEEKEDLVFLIIAKNNQNRKNVEDYVNEKGYENVIFHDVVKPEEINLYLSQCDVGLVPTWNKKDLSYWFALDNKLFEYIHAQIPILTTIQPEYKKIADNYKVGVAVNPDMKKAYSDGLETILKDYDTYKENTKLASLELNWDIEKRSLLQLYKNL